MKIFLKISLSAIILGTITAGVFVIGKSDLNQNKNQKNDSLGIIDAAVKPKNPIEEVPSLIKPQTNQNSLAAYYSGNTTESIAKKLAETIINQNPEGPKFLEGKNWLDVSNPEVLVEQALTEELQNFDINKFKPQIDPRNIKSSLATDKKALEKYFQELKSIIEENWSGISLSNNFSLDNFIQLQEANNAILKSLEQITVPMTLIELHAKELSLVTAQKNVFEALIEAEKDPIKAFLALQAFSLISDELNKLNQDFADFVSKNNLTV